MTTKKKLHEDLTDKALHVTTVSATCTEMFKRIENSLFDSLSCKVVTNIVAFCSKMTLIYF